MCATLRATRQRLLKVTVENIESFFFEIFFVFKAFWVFWTSAAWGSSPMPDSSWILSFCLSGCTVVGTHPVYSHFSETSPALRRLNFAMQQYGVASLWSRPALCSARSLIPSLWVQTNTLVRVPANCPMQVLWVLSLSDIKLRSLQYRIVSVSEENVAVGQSSFNSLVVCRSCHLCFDLLCVCVCLCM